MRLRHPRRSGFTLVELIVAAGLTVLIMAVLATGFQVGLQSLSHLKSAGELADRILTAETLLRQDLDAPHFDGGSNPGVKRLSDFRFDLPGTPEAQLPLGGFVQIRQGGASVQEGLDQDQLTSTHATNHGLSMTVRRMGKTPGELFAVTESTNVAGMAAVINANPTDVAVVANTLVCEWAEVHWFLDTSRPTVQNGVTTFPLCRRVLLVPPNTPGMAAVPRTDPLAEVVSTTFGGATNTLATVAAPGNRLGLGGTPPAITNTSARFGDDIVITNVVSFEVKPTWQGGGVAPPRFAVAGGFNADFPFDDFPPVAAPNGPLAQFDTALGGFAPATLGVGVVPTPVRVTGVQVKIRVYDQKNKMTRQSVVTSKL